VVQLKQITEKKFTQSMALLPHVWCMRIPNIGVLNHQTTPADFILQYDNSDEQHNGVLVECKECKGDKFSFKRLKQMSDLLSFHKRSKNHRSYLLLHFRDRTIKTGEAYLVGISALHIFMSSWPKKSITREEAKTEFAHFKLETTGKYWDFGPRFN